MTATDPATLLDPLDDFDPADAHLSAAELDPPVPLESHLPVRATAGPRVIAGTDMSIIPAADEMNALAQMAVTISASTTAPKALQGKPNDVFMVLLTARDLGVGVTTAIREFHVIDGRVTISPKAKLAMARQQKLGRIWPDDGNDITVATWYAERADLPGVVVSSTWTMEDAGRVRTKENGKAIKLFEKSNWQQYPARMLSWRACGYLLDDMFSEVATGLYSPDEMGAVTDEDGQVVIDVVAHAAPLPGTSAPRGHNRPPAAPPEQATDEWRDALRARIKALPEDGWRALGAMWREDVDGHPRLDPLDRLLVRQIPKAEGLVASFEARAAKGEWGPTPEPTPPPPVPQEADKAPSADPGVSGTPDSPDSPQEAPTGPSVDAGGYPTDLEALEAMLDGWDRGQLIAELRSRGLPAKGAIGDLRARLGEAIVMAGAEALDG